MFAAINVMMLKQLSTISVKEIKVVLFSLNPSHMFDLHYDITFDGNEA